MTRRTGTPAARSRCRVNPSAPAAACWWICAASVKSGRWLSFLRGKSHNRSVVCCPRAGFRQLHEASWVISPMLRFLPDLVSAFPYEVFGQPFWGGPGVTCDLVFPLPLGQAT